MTSEQTIPESVVQLLKRLGDELEEAGGDPCECEGIEVCLYCEITRSVGVWTEEEVADIRRRTAERADQLRPYFESTPTRAELDTGTDLTGQVNDDSQH